MTSSAELTALIQITENSQFLFKTWQVHILSYLGQLADVAYFKVRLQQRESPIDSDKSSWGEERMALLRVGSVTGGLKRELDLRKVLENHKMISELLAWDVKNLVQLSLAPPQPPQDLDQTLNKFADEQNSQCLEGSESNPDASINGEPETLPAGLLEEENTSTYLEEESYPDPPATSEEPMEKLMVLTALPEADKTLEHWLQQEIPLKDALAIAAQVCQFFRYAYQRGWCFIYISPKFIEKRTPIAFFDLTGAYPLDSQLSEGLMAPYCAPELATGAQIQEQMSTYTVGSLLYESIHHRPVSDCFSDLKIEPIPRIYQLLKISLSEISEDRFTLPQFLNLLVETRQFLESVNLSWEVAGRSTGGLSINRLQNEDNYGVRQQQSTHSDPLMLGIVADGMGGMAQGEVASRIAVQTILGAPIEGDLLTPESRSQWLLSTVQKANEAVASEVRDGGTTLSIVLAVGAELAIAHVGDSRIYLLRNGIICQLSEDHSMIALLLASGEIDYQESQDHPDRNVLTKSIGSKRRLSDGYVQELTRFASDFSLKLEPDDILILCSDGVWDEVKPEEMAELFSPDLTLSGGVNQVINRVLKKGASDNATLLALKLKSSLRATY